MSETRKRYILIDNCSGYIFADSASLGGEPFDGTPLEFAKAFDESIGEHERSYGMMHSAPASNSTGYHVYAVGDEMPLVDDGQDQDLIDAVDYKAIAPACGTPAPVVG